MNKDRKNPPPLTDEQKKQVEKFMKKNSRGDWNGWTAEDLYKYGWNSIPSNELQNIDLNSILNVGLKKYDLYSDIPELLTYTDNPNSAYGKERTTDHKRMYDIWNGIQLHPNGTIVGDEQTPRGAYKLKLMQKYRPDVYLEESNKIDNEIAKQLNSELINNKRIHPNVIQHPNFDINKDYVPVIVKDPVYGARYFSTLNGRFIRDNQAQRGYTAQNYDDNGNVIEIDGSTLNKPYIQSLELGNYFEPKSTQQPTGTILQINKDGSTDGYIPSIKEYKNGGPTTRRLFAVGGMTGEQMPIGEQPEEYNMVANGGSHEQNPMGGVPYGMNQDGSQNMVEQGEVSVGNNVFSDRTAISPELCQQLGLPEGTSPAQAMQQIQQLYEQGQIGDEEFQEIQQIIFEDQEAQKGGQMPQNEGLQPDMISQQNAMPAYAYGGRRCR